MNEARISSREELEIAVNLLNRDDLELQYLQIQENAYQRKQSLSRILAHSDHHLTHLQRLKIEAGENFDDSFCRDVSNLIGKNIPSLQRIDIWWFPSRMCEIITDSLLENPHLKILELYAGELGSEGAETVAAMLQHRKCSLERLLVLNNFIGDNGCASIVGALARNSSLKVLDLSHNNKIGIEGCQAIARALRNKSVAIEDLNLSYNYKIGNDGSILIADALSEGGTSLSALRLRFCGISERGLLAFAKILQNNRTTLEVLDLGGIKDGMNVKTVTAFAKALRSNTRLKKLTLSDHCNTGPEGWEAMELTLREANYTLHELHGVYRFNYSKIFDFLLALNRERPVEAEATKTGYFPNDSWCMRNKTRKKVFWHLAKWKCWQRSLASKT